MTQLRSVTWHMGSHSVTCYPTQVNTPRLNPSHAGRYSIYLPRRDGRLSWPSCLDSAPAGSRTGDLSIASPAPNHCTTKTTIAHSFPSRTLGLAQRSFTVLTDPLPGITKIVWPQRLGGRGKRKMNERKKVRKSIKRIRDVEGKKKGCNT